jgi:NAD(P)H-flavin reductase
LKEITEKSGRVVENIKIRENIFILKIESNEKISAKPGQFM